MRDGLPSIQYVWDLSVMWSRTADRADLPLPSCMGGSTEMLGNTT